jgi:Pyruvate/2-oxoacid:ferredoxin oxidoreductase delta subunit
LVTRPIIEIDEEKCDGCGDCVPVCAEGAIIMENGKAKLVAENLCDGIGNCLGICPQDAITVHERSAEAFDEEAVEKHLAEAPPTPPMPKPAPLQIQTSPAPGGGGCPGSRLRALSPQMPKPQATPGEAGTRASMLGQWPVQLTLLPPQAPLWQNADVLIAADCVPFAMPDFHERLLAGKSVAIACPKLDDCTPYVEKLTTIFSHNDIKSVSVAIMEVPCCGGLVQVVLTALEQAGKAIPVEISTIGVRGTVDHTQRIEPRVAAAR